jgi:hypothetical protein
VSGDARIKQNVDKSTDIILIGRIGSREDTATIIGNEINVGCFTGTLDMFKDAVTKTHKDNKYAQEYFAMLKFVKELQDIRKQ